MKTWKYSFRSVPILSSTSEQISHRTVQHTIVYDMYHVGHHTMELSFWRFVFAFEWLLGIVVFAMSTFFFLALSSAIFGAWTMAFWICVVIGGLLSLVMSFYVVIGGVVQNSMRKVAVRERGGKKADWRCVKEQDWERFRKSLSRGIQ